MMDKAAIWETASIDIPALLRFCEKAISQDIAESAFSSAENASVLELPDTAEKKVTANDSVQPKKKKNIDPEL